MPYLNAEARPVMAVADDVALRAAASAEFAVGMLSVLTISRQILKAFS